MGFNLGIETALANMNISFETMLLVIFLFGGLIFFARNFIIGVMMYFFGSGAIFIWFHTAGLNFIPFLTIFFISLVVLTLTLYATSRQAIEGGVI